MLPPGAGGQGPRRVPAGSTRSFQGGIPLTGHIHPLEPSRNPLKTVPAANCGPCRAARKRLARLENHPAHARLECLVSNYAVDIADHRKDTCVSGASKTKRVVATLQRSYRAGTNPKRLAELRREHGLVGFPMFVRHPRCQLRISRRKLLDGGLQQPPQPVALPDRYTLHWDAPQVLLLQPVSLKKFAEQKIERVTR